ncbi:hypothetical protein [Streptomyces sp. MNP-20]|uniref:hypothetical protein n=1 Tax=Streptomyces sp. MNP-20 TaxID=2721165 RepID=UPI00155625D7|nr:hypothetical protein [Streptomyces sp. MNP-20]
MPRHTPEMPTPEQIRQATRTLADLAVYLRTHPPLDEALELLAPLLDADDGVQILLGDALRSAERLVARHAQTSWTEETRAATDAFRAASQEATDWHVLHWDLQRMQALRGAPSRVPPR